MDGTIESGASTSYGNIIDGADGSGTSTLEPGYSDAGEHTVYYRITGGTYYNTVTGSVKVTISKKSLDLGTYSAEYHMRHTTYTRTVTGVNSKSITATYSPVVNEVGSYSYVKSINNPGQYTIALSDSTNYEVGSAGIFTINKKSVEVTWGSTTSFDYDGTAKAPTVSVSSGVAEETITVTRTTATNAGDHISTASCSSVSGGGSCSNYTITNPTKDFTINKVAAVLTCSNKTYTGSEQTGCTCSGGTVGGTNKATNAGEYTASCTGDSNHTSPANKTWRIAPKEPTITVTKLTGKDVSPSFRVYVGSNTTGLTKYVIYYGTDTSTLTSSVTINSSNTSESTDITVSSAGKNYYFQVRAHAYTASTEDDNYTSSKNVGTAYKSCSYTTSYTYYSTTTNSSKTEKSNVIANPATTQVAYSAGTYPIYSYYVTTVKQTSTVKPASNSSILGSNINTYYKTTTYTDLTSSTVKPGSSSIMVGSNIQTWYTTYTKLKMIRYRKFTTVTWTAKALNSSSKKTESSTVGSSCYTEFSDAWYTNNLNEISNGVTSITTVSKSGTQYSMVSYTSNVAYTKAYNTVNITYYISHITNYTGTYFGPKKQAIGHTILHASPDAACGSILKPTSYRTTWTYSTLREAISPTATITTYTYNTMWQTSTQTATGTWYTHRIIYKSTYTTQYNAAGWTLTEANTWCN